MFLSCGSSTTCRCDSTERIQSKLDYLRSELNDSVVFKNIYRYAFDFARVSLLFLICLKSSLTPPENLVFADHRWFTISPCCSNVHVYSRRTNQPTNHSHQ